MATDPTVGVGEEYPSGDGKPMAETEIHRDCLMAIIEMLGDHFADAKNVYVGGNLFVYFRRAGVRRAVSPDVFVVRGVPKLPKRDVFVTGDEGRNPDLVIEVTSPGTRYEDEYTKHDIYRDDLRVREYFLFDPRSEYLSPAFQGYRLNGTQYVPIEPAEGGRLTSEVLGCDLIRSGTFLRLWDAAAGRLVPSRAERLRDSERLREEEQRLREEEQRLRQEEQRLRQDAERRAWAAEEEVAELRRQINALRGGPAAE